MMGLGDRYTSDTDCASPPDFTKGYPLPEGWQWACYDDGTGCLEAPDGYCYLDYMDLPKGGLRLPNGHYLDEPRADEIARLLECDIIPQHNARVALASEHPDWWCAFNPHTFYYHDVPTSAVRVAISPEKSMDAAEFRSLLEELRQADAWLTTCHLAEMLSRSPTVPHKGVTVEAKSIEPIVFACTATLADAPMASKSPDGERTRGLDRAPARKRGDGG